MNRLGLGFLFTGALSEVLFVGVLLFVEAPTDVSLVFGTVLAIGFWAVIANESGVRTTT